MKLAIPKCPTCGAFALGTVDTIPGIALLSHEEDGTAFYMDETKVDWDNQRTITEDRGDGEIIYLVTCGDHNWWTAIEDHPQECDLADNDEFKCAKCHAVKDNDDSIRCPQCGQLFCDICYPTEERNGCADHQEKE